MLRADNDGKRSGQRRLGRRRLRRRTTFFGPSGPKDREFLLRKVCKRNVCFWRIVNRNRLFMTGRQSLYAVYLHEGEVAPDRIERFGICGTSLAPSRRVPQRWLGGGKAQLASICGRMLTLHAAPWILTHQSTDLPFFQGAFRNRGGIVHLAGPAQAAGNRSR